MTKTGFLDMVKASQKGIERTLDPNLQATPPETCDPKICPIDMCPSRLDETQWGKPCRYYTPKTEDKPLSHSIPTTSYSKGYTLTEQIEKVISKVMKPFEERLALIEAQANTPIINRSFNGRRLRVDIGMNEERINDG